MVLLHEQWHVYENGQLRLATQEEIDKHFANRQPDQNYWYNDHS